jgi:hypothetical protein
MLSSTSFDLGGIVLLEHINIDVTSREHCELFYVALGGTPDQSVPTRMNFGLQQFHLGLRQSAQIINGHIGLLLPNLSDLTSRLVALSEKLAGTQFAWRLEKEDGDEPSPRNILSSYKGPVVAVTCPFGNHFRVYEYSKAFGMNSKIGILYVYFNCPIGTARIISEFFSRIYSAHCNVAELTLSDSSETYELATVSMGAWQNLFFAAVEEPEAFARREYHDYHLCFYVADFTGSYQRSVEDNTLLAKHRFDDRFTTMEEALCSRQFRNFTIRKTAEKGEAEGQEVYKMHQEVRTVLHGAYCLPLNNLTV